MKNGSLVTLSPSFLLLKSCGKFKENARKTHTHTHTHTLTLSLSKRKREAFELPS